MAVLDVVVEDLDVVGKVLDTTVGGDFGCSSGDFGCSGGGLGRSVEVLDIAEEVLDVVVGGGFGCSREERTSHSF